MLCDLTVQRDFMSHEYGGSCQALLSEPREDKIQEHGIELFVYARLALHPLAPQRPGYPGLIFSTCAKVFLGPWRINGTFMCFAGLNTAVWQFVGKCELKGYEVLTKEEWRELPHSVRTFSSMQIKSVLDVVSIDQ